MMLKQNNRYNDEIHGSYAKFRLFCVRISIYLDSIYFSLYRRRLVMLWNGHDIAEQAKLFVLIESRFCRDINYNMFICSKANLRLRRWECRQATQLLVCLCSCRYTLINYHEFFFIHFFLQLAIDYRKKRAPLDLNLRLHCYK